MLPLALCVLLGLVPPDGQRDGSLDDAIATATKAIERDPRDPVGYLLRGSAYAQAHRYPLARADLDRAIALDPKRLEAYQERGTVHFNAMRFEASVRDFDRVIALDPSRKASHWQRGISLYYAGHYAEGRRQFEGYQEYDSKDVENAIWRFMCMARADGIDTARRAMLKIGPDKRIPMRQVYDLFKGDRKPDDVLAAAQAGAPNAETLSRQLFYAHLYIGIYYDLLGERARALDHLNRAADEYAIGHYMGNVARVQRDLLKKTLPK